MFGIRKITWPAQIQTLTSLNAQWQFNDASKLSTTEINWILKLNWWTRPENWTLVQRTK